MSTSRPGVYVCGTFEGPKDIPETIVQSSAAACLAMAAVGRTDAGALFPEENPPERDIAGEPPRIGVFVCDCGFNIGGVIDVEAVVAHAGTLDGVVVAERAGHGCSSAAMERIENIIREKGLNRVVIGGCSPRTHEKVFQNTLRKAGLNKYLLEIANIRDQDAWVHGHLTERATEKAKDFGAHGRQQHPLSTASHRPHASDQQGCVGGGGRCGRHDRSIESGRTGVQGDHSRADALVGRFGRTASQEFGGGGYWVPCQGADRSSFES